MSGDLVRVKNMYASITYTELLVLSFAVHLTTCRFRSFIVSFNAGLSLPLHVDVGVDVIGGLGGL